MLSYLLIALGGALGSVARQAMSDVVGLRFDSPFPSIPWGTLVVNVTGSFAIGFFASYTGPAGRHFASSDLRLFLMTGVCGGYTTFSAFSLQTMNLIRAGDGGRAAAYIVGSVALCLLGTWLGYLLGTSLSPQS